MENKKMEIHQERQKYLAHMKFVQFDCRLHSSHFSQKIFCTQEEACNICLHEYEDILSENLFILRLMPDEVTDIEADIIGYFSHSCRTVVDTSQVPEILTV